MGSSLAQVYSDLDIVLTVWAVGLYNKAGVALWIRNNGTVLFGFTQSEDVVDEIECLLWSGIRFGDICICSHFHAFVDFSFAVEIGKHDDLGLECGRKMPNSGKCLNTVH